MSAVKVVTLTEFQCQELAAAAMYRRAVLAELLNTRLLSDSMQREIKNVSEALRNAGLELLA